MCSYCGCADLTIVGRFMAEHEEIINHLGAVRAGLHDEAARHEAVDHLASHLWPHTEAEEVGLFAVLARDDVFTDHIASLCDEHEQIGELLGLVRQGEVDRWPEFEQVLRDHIDREDNGLFPASAIHLDGPDWDEVEALTPLGHSGDGNRTS